MKQGPHFACKLGKLAPLPWLSSWPLQWSPIQNWASCDPIGLILKRNFKNWNCRTSKVRFLQPDFENWISSFLPWLKWSDELNLLKSELLKRYNWLIQSPQPPTDHVSTERKPLRPTKWTGWVASSRFCTPNERVNLIKSRNRVNERKLVYRDDR